MKYGALSLAGIALSARSEDAVKEKKSPLSFDKQKSKYSTNEEKSSYSDITSYNNFYEFGTGKEDNAIP
ncbi:MAG: protein-methionine-sulfoxide reductase catalytic subunit MsrP, partial [Burkholderiales bacterium]|nr:protein-methionine-sulfoxide reductase catalytic subunit MsrP [Burkholderiales bacterium]